MDRSKWEYKKLGEVATFERGLTYSKGDEATLSTKGVLRSNNIDLDTHQLVFDEIKYLNPNFVIPESKKLKKDSIFICMSNGSKAHLGKVAFADKDYDYAFGGFMGMIVPKYIFPRFLFYYFLSNNYRNGLEQIGKGANINNLRFAQLAEFNVPTPVIADQQRIVAELDCLNEMIAVKQKQLKEFDKLAQSIFYDMFESIDNYVPASHYIESLGGGKSLAGEEECINKVLKTGAVTYDYFKEDEVKNLPKDYEPLKEHLLRDGDLLVSRMNTLEYVGAIAYVWKAPQNTYLPDRLWRAKLKSGANPIYLWFSLKQEKAKEQIRAKASGTSGSMKNISMPKFLSTTIKEAPLSLQQQFADKISAIEAQKELVKQSIAETQALLSYTMDKYFG